MRWRQAKENDFDRWLGFIGEQLAGAVRRHDSTNGPYWAAYLEGLEPPGDRIPGRYDTVQEAMRAAEKAKWAMEQAGP
jgi:hypothetical protein